MAGFEPMKVFMIGGTGLLGSQAADELIRRGHTVTTLALPPAPEGARLPEGMAVEFGNFMELSDDDLTERLQGCDGLVFAAGVDERVEGPPPIYDLFARFNVAALDRLLRLARDAGVRHTVVCGSYFSYFAKQWPDLQLTRWHPYIRARIDQERMALSHAGPGFDVAVLELPYIFGAQPGRKPVWVFLVEQIRAMPRATMYPPGGTTMVTVRQVGQAIAGALERNSGGAAYPIGWYNLTWVELLRIIHRHLGCPDKRIATIPKWLYRLSGRQIMRQQRKAGHEAGLHMVKFADLMCAATFIDKDLGCEPLGVEPDDIDAAIGESVRLSVDLIEGRTHAIDMKGE